MAGVKSSTSFELQEDTLRMLNAAAEKYDLGDAGKALRCLIDYAAQDGDWDSIFGRVRCLRCGGRPGWTEKAS
jgi:hypothetical protein